MRKVLCIVAHNDDETLGPGASLARHVANGDFVVVAVATMKMWGSHDAVIVKEAYNQMTIRACEKLGVTDVRFGLFKNADLGSQFPAVLEWCERLAVETEADVLYTHSDGDRHQDHVALSRIGEILVRPTSMIKQIRKFEVASGQLLKRPVLYVDVDGYLERKVDALNQYAGEEVFKYPHPRSPENVRALAMVRGQEVGLRFAEAFDGRFIE